jgi:hypothetical protein
MEQGRERAPTKRRDFLRLVGLGSVAGAATIAAGAPEAPAAAAPEEKGYRETAHVKKFYETAKF